MDLSALIFVALAVAWAVYLVPKALKHHDEMVRSRSVDRFSHSMRVLARREPVSRKDARLVVTPGRAAAAPVITAKPSSAPGPAVRVTSTGRAVRRRRRVLGLLLLVMLAVIGAAVAGLVSWWSVAAPSGLLLAWLAACRLMVRREQGAGRVSPRWAVPVAEVPEPVAEQAGVAPADDDLHDPTRAPVIDDPSLWDPMPVTLPTYVTKPVAARRTVRTIDLDSSGVWTSGRTEVDARIAREADESARPQRAGHERDEPTKAVGT